MPLIHASAKRRHQFRCGAAAAVAAAIAIGGVVSSGCGSSTDQNEASPESAQAAREQAEAQIRAIERDKEESARSTNKSGTGGAVKPSQHPAAKKTSSQKTRADREAARQRALIRGDADEQVDAGDSRDQAGGQGSATADRTDQQGNGESPMPSSGNGQGDVAADRAEQAGAG